MTLSMAGRNLRKLVALQIALLLLVAGALVAAPAAFADTHEPRDLFGTIVSTGETSFIVLTDDGEVEVLVSDETEVRLPSNDDGELTDLMVGDVVAVSVEDEEGVLTADKVHVIPGKTRTRHIPGEVVDLSDVSISVLPFGDNAATVTLDLTSDTKVNFHHGIDELGIGSFVIAVTKQNAQTGELGPEAIEINVVRAFVEEAEESEEDSPGTEIELKGIFQGLDESGTWLVDVHAITADANTEVDEGIVAGDLVKVHGWLLSGGTLLAREIEKEDDDRVDAVTRIRGPFEGVDDQGRWIVAGTPIVVDQNTDTDGLPEIRQLVKVKAMLLDSGDLVAREIQNHRGRGQGRGEDTVKIEGIFESIDENGNWIVNSTVVSVGPQTKVEGSPTVGEAVEVKGTVGVGNQILASKVEAEDDDDERKSEVEAKGTIEEVLANSVIVNGINFTISSLTEIDGTPAVGAYAKVEAYLAEDGTLFAREIDVRENVSSGEEPDDERDDDDEVEIEGKVDEVLLDGSIVVNGILVVISEDTEVEGELLAGGSVKVEGLLSEDGSLLADEVKGEGRRARVAKSEVDFEGVVEEVNRNEAGDIVSIVVDGVEISIDVLTRTKGSIEVGVTVEIDGVVIDGTILAAEIEVERNRDDSDEDDGEGEAGEGDDGDDHEDREHQWKLEGLLNALALDDTGNVTAITVNGITIIVTAETDVKGELVPGVEVEVEATLVEGSPIANEIEVEESKSDSYFGSLDDAEEEEDRSDRGAPDDDAADEGDDNANSGSSDDNDDDATDESDSGSSSGDDDAKDDNSGSSS